VVSHNFFTSEQASSIVRIAIKTFPADVSTFRLGEPGEHISGAEVSTFRTSDTMGAVY
jgi:hypothetical protein